MWRAITRHSSVDALTRVCSPAASWFTRRDIAVGQEAAQLELEPIHEIEGRLRRLRRVPLDRVHGVHLEHGGHRLVREAPDVGETARLLDAESAVEVAGDGVQDAWLRECA